MTDRGVSSLQTAVYYFSGTGNTLYIAKALSHSLSAALIPIASLAGAEEITPDADAIGIVYPVYYNDLPVIVKEFAGKLRGLRGKYVFAVCTYGGCGSRSVKSLGERLGASGGTLELSYGIHMPQNAFSKPWENNLRIIERAAERVEKISGDVKARKKGNNLKGLLNFVFVRLHPSLLPRIKADLAKKAGMSPETELDTLIRRADRSFHTNGKCVGLQALRQGLPRWEY